MLEWETVGQPHPHWEVTNRDSPRGNAEDILPEWEGVRRGPKGSEGVRSGPKGSEGVRKLPISTIFYVALINSQTSSLSLSLSQLPVPVSSKVSSS